MKGLSKAQSSVIVLVLLVGVALAIGIGFLSYFTSMSRESSRELQRESLIAYEITNQLIRTIAVDTSRGDLWLLFKRLDNTNGTFFITAELFNESGESTFLSCSDIHVYVEKNENGDNLLCYNNDVIDANECPSSNQLTFLYPEKMLLRPASSGDWINLNLYKAQVGEPTVKQPMPLCKFSYEPGENKIVLIKAGLSFYKARIYLAMVFQDTAYVLRTYEIWMR